MKTVLIAEDDRLWSERLERVFVRAGFRVVKSATWDKTANLIRTGSFELFICDLALGVMPEAGFELLSEFSNRIVFPTVIISNSISNILLSKCHEFPFVKSVVVKSNIENHFDELSGIAGIDENIFADEFYGVGAEVTMATSRPLNKNDIFVVHGRNALLVRGLFDLVRAVGLKPIPFETVVNATGSGAPFVGSAITHALENCGAVLVVLSPDDEVRLRKTLRADRDLELEKKLTGQARPNVLFEAGIAFGVKPEKTILLRVRDAKPFSDVDGRHYVSFDGGTESKNRLVERMRAIGCPVDTSDGGWMEAGNFADALKVYD